MYSIKFGINLALLHKDFRSRSYKYTSSECPWGISVLVIIFLSVCMYGCVSIANFVKYFKKKCVIGTVGATYDYTHWFFYLLLQHGMTALFSSPEPLAHGELLWSLDVRRVACCVRRQQLLQTTSPPKLLAGFWPNLVGMILIWPSFKIVQMVLVHCISRSHILKIDFQDENFKNLLLWNHKA